MGGLGLTLTNEKNEFVLHISPTPTLCPCSFAIKHLFAISIGLVMHFPIGLTRCPETFGYIVYMYNLT